MSLFGQPRWPQPQQHAEADMSQSQRVESLLRSGFILCGKSGALGAEGGAMGYEENLSSAHYFSLLLFPCRALLSTLQGQNAASKTVDPECDALDNTLISGSRTPELNISSPSAGSDIPAAAPTSTPECLDGQTMSVTSMGRKPSFLRLAGAAAPLDDGNMETETT